MFSKLRRWLSGLFGGSEDGDADAEPSGEPDYVCSVCRTSVPEPDGTCSLCRSSDIVPADEPGEDGDGESPEPAERREQGSADEMAARLRDVRNDDDG